MERAANIRIQHPNLSTEDAMKLAGYTGEEAKDPKRQSNVRQKTHRLTKGRKRPPNAADMMPGSDVKRPSIGIDAESPGRPLHGVPNDQGGGSDYYPLPLVDYGPSFDQVDGAAAEPHPYETPQRPPSSGPGRPLSEMHRTPGSARAEKAARFWMDNPNLSIENAMKLAGYSEPETKDKYKQNDIRQIAQTLKFRTAVKGNKGNSNVMSSELRGRLTAIDRKIDEMANRLERTVDVKLKELGARIDDKFNYVHQQLHMMGGTSGPTSSYEHIPGSGQIQQQQQPHHLAHPQQQYAFQHGGNYPQMQQQPPQPQGYPPPTHSAGAPIQAGPLYGHSRPSMHSAQRHDSMRSQDGKQRHMDSTVAL